MRKCGVVDAGMWTALSPFECIPDEPVGAMIYVCVLLYLFQLVRYYWALMERPADSPEEKNRRHDV